MTQVSYLEVELRARADQYQRQMRQSTESSKRFARGAKEAEGASRKMGDSISRAANSVAIIDGPLGGVAGRLSSVAAGFSSVGVAATLAGTAIAASTYAVVKSATAYADLERRQAKTNALLKATGYSAGLTARELDSLARQIALGTLASTQDVREAIDVLLTFKSVRGREFRETIKLSQDLAVVIGGTAKTAALQLGKALEDPVAGMTALKRSGVSFTASEKEMVKQLVEANKVLEAQQLILQKVAGQVGGAGSAEAQGLSGMVDTLGQRWDELLEAMGRTPAQASAVGIAFKGLTRTIEDITYVIDPEAMDQQLRFNELFRERQEIMERLNKEMNGRNYAELPQLPIPGIYDVNDWRSDQQRLTALNEILKAIQARRMEEQKASQAAKEAAEQARKVEESERAAAEAAEARAKANERAQKIMEQQGGLWQKIFGGPQRKTDGPVEEHTGFAYQAHKARGTIQAGDAVNAKAYIAYMEQILGFAQRDMRHNYDVAGMKDVIEAMKSLSESRFGDSAKAIAKQQQQESRYEVTAGDRRWASGAGVKDAGEVIAGNKGSAEKGSVVELRSESVNLNLAADSAKVMGEQITKALEAAQTQTKAEPLGSIEFTMNSDGKKLTGILMGEPAFLREMKQFVEKSTRDSARAVAQ